MKNGSFSRCLFSFLLFRLVKKTVLLNLTWGMVCTGGKVLRELFGNNILPLLEFVGLYCVFCSLVLASSFFSLSRHAYTWSCLLPVEPSSPKSCRFLFLFLSFVYLLSHCFCCVVSRWFFCYELYAAGKHYLPVLIDLFLLVPIKLLRYAQKSVYHVLIKGQLWWNFSWLIWSIFNST